MSLNAPDRTTWRLPVAFFLSGAGSLGAQMIWAKLFGLGLGHEVPSLLAVLTAVMTGLAFGSALWRSDRFQLHPARACMWVELGIGCSLLFSLMVIPWASGTAQVWIGVDPSPWRHWAISFCVPLLVLLPATTAMGATLPAMESLVVTPSQSRLGWVYGWNTFGAVIGCLVATFVFLPAVGFTKSLAICALANGLSALFFWMHPIAGSGAPISRARRSGNLSLGPRRLGWTLFATGFLGIAFEIVAVRGLSQLLENTIYSYALALSVFLLGTALGAAAYHQWGRSRHPIDLPRWLMAAISIAILAGIGFFPRLREWGQMIRGQFGDGSVIQWCVEWGMSAVIFFVPCLGMGAVFSHLVALARHERSGVGQPMAWNYLGSALAGPIVGVFVLPALGMKGSLLTIAGAYLLLLPHPRSWSWLAAWVLGGLLFLLPSDLRLAELPSGSSLLAYRTGVMANVSVLEDPAKERVLRVNNRFQMGGTSSLVAQRRQAHLPLLLAPSPKRALFLGPGTGITLGAATMHGDVSIEAVELVPEVLELMSWFAPQNRYPFKPDQVTLHAADARRFVRTSTTRYDVVVADLFHPAQDGSGSLYTVEHFQAIRNRLTPSGLFCQWIPLHQMDYASLQLVVRSFLAVFSSSEAWLLHFNVDVPVMALIGRTESGPRDWLKLVEPRRASVDAAELRGVGFPNSIQILGCWLAGSEGLKAMAGAGPLNTDDAPRLTFLAPKAHRGPGSDPLGTLNEVLRVTATAKPSPTDLPAMSDQVAGFIEARNLYLEGLMLESKGEFASAMEHHFSSTRRSLYFTPAYARLVGAIQAMAQGDKEQARKLYEKLLTAQPEQPLGRQVLGPLFEK